MEILVESVKTIEGSVVVLFSEGVSQLKEKL